jgi:hypothetical protein
VLQNDSLPRRIENFIARVLHVTIEDINVDCREGKKSEKPVQECGVWYVEAKE